MGTKKEKSDKGKNLSGVSEPQVTYNMDVNALKLEGINALMSISNPTVLEKAVNSLLKTAGQTWDKAAIIEEEEETIGKEEILANIREALLEIKERQRTGEKPKTAEELLNEL
jgi:uncharacterized protein (UPF0254 family)